MPTPSQPVDAEGTALNSPSQWWEITVVGVPLLDDLLFWRLQTEGCQGTASQLANQQRTVWGYLPQDCTQESDLKRIADLVRQDVLAVGQPAPKIHWQGITEEDWAHSWQDYWHPQEIGDRILIYPAWLPVPEQGDDLQLAIGDRLLLRLNPGVAFGTGAHATTQLCLQALEKHLGIKKSTQPLSIADIGCGSGILSIAAVLLGADQAYAVDLDPLAVSAAQDSRDLNGLTSEQLWIAQGSIEQISQQIPGPVQGFCCNILADVILNLIPQFTDITAKGSWGILSGILDTQRPMISASLQDSSWQLVETNYDQDWCSLTIQRL